MLGSLWWQQLATCIHFGWFWWLFGCFLRGVLIEGKMVAKKLMHWDIEAFCFIVSERAFETKS